MANKDTDKYSCSRPAFHLPSTEEWQSRNKRERLTTNSQYPHRTAPCAQTPLSALQPGGHHQELHLTSSAALTAHRSLTLQLLEFPPALVRQLHLLWQFWLNYIQYILEKVQIEFSEACSLNLFYLKHETSLTTTCFYYYYYFFLINLKVVILLEIQVVCYKAVSNDTVSEFRRCRILILTMQITDNSSEGKGTCL